MSTWNKVRLIALIYFYVFSSDSLYSSQQSQSVQSDTDVDCEDTVSRVCKSTYCRNMLLFFQAPVVVFSYNMVGCLFCEFDQNS